METEEGEVKEKEEMRRRSEEEVERFARNCKRVSALRFHSGLLQTNVAC